MQMRAFPGAADSRAPDPSAEHEPARPPLHPDLPAARGDRPGALHRQGIEPALFYASVKTFVILGAIAVAMSFGAMKLSERTKH